MSKKAGKVEREGVGRGNKASIQVWNYGTCPRTIKKNNPRGCGGSETLIVRLQWQGSRVEKYIFITGNIHEYLYIYGNFL